MTEPTFTVGPPQPVTDSRQLPAVTPADEDGFVTGDDLGPDHPDNGPDEAEATAGASPPPAGDPTGDLPGEDALDLLVVDVDPDGIDPVGFDAQPAEGGA